MLELLEHNIKLIAGILGGLGAIYLFFGKALPVWRKIYVASMKVVDSIPILEDIAKEFKPNGGSSLRDSINRIEAGVHSSVERDWLQYENDTRGIFEVDARGTKCRVNKAWSLLTGVAEEDAVNGYGWINGIHVSDRERVRQEWDSAIRENRTSEMEYTTATGIRVLAVAKILRVKTSGATLGWFGTLTPID